MRFFLFIASAFLAATTANAACEPQFTTHSQAVNLVGVALGTGNIAVETFTVRIKSSDPSACIVQLRVSHSSPGDLSLPPYALFSSGQQIDIAPSELAATNSSDFAVTAASGNGNDVPFELRLPTEWGLKEGNYAEPLQLSLVGSDGAILDRLNLNVNVQIPAAVALSLVGATGGGSGPAQINLGTLSSTQDTQSQPFGIRVWSTSPYTVGFASINRGKLIQAGGPDSIPYLLTMDSRPIDLSSGSTRIAVTQHTESRGDLHHLDILVRPVHALAGSYSDRVTITVTAI